MSNAQTELNALQQAVVRTVCYFDLFEYPLTLIELHHLLHKHGEQVDISQLRAVATDPAMQSRLSFTRGFVTLHGRESIIDERLLRYRLAHKKHAIAMRGIKLLQAVPGVRFVGICNNLSFNNVNRDGDIDLFIVTEPNRIFLTRLLVTSILQLAGLRRHGGRIADRICLSFYVTSDALDLSGIRLAEDDPYLAYWIANLQPVCGDGYRQMLEANTWVRNDIPMLRPKKSGYRRRVEPGRAVRLSARIFDTIIQSRLGGALERGANRLQLSKMKRNTKSIAHAPDTRVVISESMLKFHENDRRELYRDSFYKLARRHIRTNEIFTTGN